MQKSFIRLEMLSSKYIHFPEHSETFSLQMQRDQPLWYLFFTELAPSNKTSVLPGPGTYIMQKTTHASCSMRTGFVKICLCEHSRYFLLVEIPPQFPLTPITYFHVMIQFLCIWLWFCRTYLYSILLIRK